MALREADAVLLAAALVAAGVDPPLVIETYAVCAMGHDGPGSATDHCAHLTPVQGVEYPCGAPLVTTRLVPRDFTTRDVITRVVEAWWERDPDYRLWRLSSAHEDAHWRRPWADVRDGGPVYHGIGDTPWEALARALLAWAVAAREGTCRP